MSVSNTRNKDGVSHPILTTTRGQEFSVFDTFPKELRDRLNYSPFPFSSVDAERVLKKYGLRNTLVVISQMEEKLRGCDGAAQT